MFPSNRTPLWTVTLLYAATLIYLNLIPVDFNPLPPEEWRQRAMAMPWLNLGVAQRADWIANLFLATPFGFLLASALGRSSRFGRLRAILLGIPTVLALILAIEVLQIGFPPRTVSQNDVAAGWLGGGIGILVWAMAGDRLWRLAWAAAHPHRRTLLAGIGLYALAYLALSLFPYDFFVNAQELSAKLDATHLGFTAITCSSILRCAASIFAEIIAVVPLGIALALWRNKGTEIPPGPPLSKGGWKS
jgi:glycopeptide antibiotics resistance protein